MQQTHDYFSLDPVWNPMMANWNKVFLRYCDGGSFSGNNETTESHLNVRNNGFVDEPTELSLVFACATPRIPNPGHQAPLARLPHPRRHVRRPDPTPRPGPGYGRRR
jgi:hypothetical protein